MKHERMDLAEFFALPDSPPGMPVSGFGYAGLKEEGAPLYRDGDGCMWSLQKTANGEMWRSFVF